jgi:cell division protein FtsL
MTPSALTPAARGSTKKSRPDASSRSSSARSAGHRPNVRRPVAPAAPRRVSGPARGVASAAASTSGGVIAVPAPARTRPTRPARPARPTRSRRARSAARAPWRLRTSAYVRALPDHALLDRIIRGRVWIPLLGVLLAGIVAMQVEVLKLNAGTGRSLEKSSALQGQNELLRASVAGLSDEQRIERIAAQMGMVMPAPSQLRFVRPGAGRVEQALGSIHAPDGTSFIAQLPTIGAPAAPQGTSGNTALGLTPTATASTTSSTSATPATSTTATATAGTSSSGTATTTGVGATPVGG